MSEGEMKKRISNMDWAIYCDYGPCEPFKEDLETIIDDARTDFPDFGKLTNIVCSEFEFKAQEWFLKWLGVKQNVK